MSTVIESQQKSKPRWSLLTNIPRPHIEKQQLYFVCKRGFDLVVCLTVLPIVLCVLAIIAVSIVLDSPGSPFFVQERVGKDGRRFRLYKFRTLSHDYENPEHRALMQSFVLGQNISNGESASFKPPLYKHITRLGSVLRKTSLDELPQILNVLKGDMSLIGPRPNVVWEVEKYKDWHYERLKVLPGITGLAQVRGRSSISFDAIVQSDIEYIRAQSLKLDMQILWWTVRSVVKGDGAG
jgi:lipopolysaccharide/colanic/teichoic acid biosynthesis glycosyltransferase